MLLALAMALGAGCGSAGAEPPEGGLELTAEPYGGFEQVAALPERIVRGDRQTTAQPGDIMLYSGGSIVLFYGSNSWNYTRLGRISGLDEAELTELLGGDGVNITLSVPS